ncbi:hypothetical protein JHK84_042801 [Glycine max]|nr:hypothetical protein JHK84_042801 [Glycine max]
MQLLQSNYNAEFKMRESLPISSNALKRGPKKKFYRLTKLKAQKRSCHVVRSTVDRTIGHTLTTGILIRLDHALLCGILGYSDKLMMTIGAKSVKVESSPIS